MNSIISDQNNTCNLKKLAAQRQLYSEAKKVQNGQLILTVPTVIIFSFIVVYFPQLNTYYALWGVILWLLNRFLIKNWINSLKTTAVKIQELFDCELFDLKWNSSMAGTKPNEDEITEAANRYYLKHDNKDLLDWYNRNISRYSFKIARLKCQKINCWWDGKIRRNYSIFIVTTLVLITLLILVSGLIGDITVKNLLLKILFPLLPIYHLGIFQYQENSKAILTEEHLKTQVNKLVEKNDVSDESSRSIQNEIFNHRKNSPLIYDFYYFIYKNRFEKQVKELV